jgi:hypothetical protein
LAITLSWGAAVWWYSRYLTSHHQMPPPLVTNCEATSSAEGRTQKRGQRFSGTTWAGGSTHVLSFLPGIPTLQAAI